MRIGLLGGTFDPPHLGHLVAAECARVELDLDQVQFVVAGAPWMKETCSPAEDRVTMVELAVADNAAFEVNRTEVDRDGLTYTVDTLEQLRADDPDADLVFLVGADAAVRIPQWRRGDRCLELARFVVLTRPGYHVDLEGPVFGALDQLDVPGVDVSSSELRDRFRDGRAVRYQVPDAVVDHARNHDLYGTG